MVFDRPTLERIGKSGIEIMRSMVDTSQRVKPHLGAEGIELAGGYGAYLGANGPCTQAGGMGVFEPITAGQLDALEAFYRTRKSRIQFKLSPLCDPHSASLAVSRATRVEEFEQVLAMPVEKEAPVPTLPGIEIREAKSDEFRIYHRTVTEAFMGVGPEVEGFDDIFEILFHDPNIFSFIAFANGEIAGGGALGVGNGIGWMQGAGVLERFRGRGIHKALLQTRLNLAHSQECELVCMGALPAGTSQQNAQKTGFEIAMTRISLEWD